MTLVEPMKQALIEAKSESVVAHATKETSHGNPE